MVASSLLLRALSMIDHAPEMPIRAIETTLVRICERDALICAGERLPLAYDIKVNSNGRVVSVNPFNG